MMEDEKKRGVLKGGVEIAYVSWEELVGFVT